MSECIVCLQPGGNKRCRCNTTVHDTCLNRMMQSVPSHNGTCAVCKQAYSNVELRHYSKYTCTTLRALLVFVVLYAGVCLQVFSLLVWVVQIDRVYAQILVLICTASLISYMTIVVFVHVHHAREMRFACCCARVHQSHFVSTLNIV